MTADLNTEQRDDDQERNPEKWIQIRTWLERDGPDGPPSISSVVQTWLRRRRQDLFPDARLGRSTQTGVFWPASFFQLHRVLLFERASSDVQQRILQECSCSVLQEALHIEQAGVAFAAKMSLLAKDATERQLYGVFVADEVAHMQALRPYVSAESVPDNDGFLGLLSSLIESGSRSCLQYVIQVVLEGWGLTHYRKLRDACLDVELQNVFDRILSDEAAHHGSGVVLLDDAHNLSVCQNEVLRWMRRFLYLVQLGPISTLAVLERHVGLMDAKERRNVLQEMDATLHSASRLELLRDLMCKPNGGEKIVANLENEGAFRPWSTADWV